MKINRVFFTIIMLWYANCSFAQSFHDMLLENVKGSVKSITYKRSEGSEYVTFAKDGKIGKKDIFSPVYNKDGYLIKCKSLLLGHIGETTFIYKNNNVEICRTEIGGGLFTIHYIYNTDGTVYQEVQSLEKGNIKQTAIYTFKYHKFDSHGNWNTRTVYCGENSFFDHRVMTYWK